MTISSHKKEIIMVTVDDDDDKKATKVYFDPTTTHSLMIFDSYHFKLFKTTRKMWKF
jgi:hypothetical protein